MKASIRQISEMTGFSPATVSNALNNKRGVNHETAAKILEAAHACGYLSEGQTVLWLYLKSRRMIAGSTKKS